MKKLALVTALALSLTGCGEIFSNPNINEKLISQNQRCLEMHMEPVYEAGSPLGRQPQITCQPAKLSMLQKLEFMTWVARREGSKKPVLMPEEMVHGTHR